MRRLAGRAQEQQKRGRGDHTNGAVFDRPRVGSRRDQLKVERAERGKDQQHSENEAEVADAVDDKRFLAGVSR